MKMGEIIRRLRMERELTQEKLASMMGITSQAVSKWERDEGLPDITLLPALAEALDCSTDDLLGVKRRLSDNELDGIERKTIEIIFGDQSEAAFKNPNADEGLEYLREELKKHPAEWRIHQMLAGFLHLGGKDEAVYRERLEHYEYVRSHAPDISSRLEGIVGLVNTYAEAREYEKAEEAAKELPTTFLTYTEQARRFLRGDRLREHLRDMIITGVLAIREYTYQFTHGVYDVYLGKMDKSHSGTLDEQLALVELAVKCLVAMLSTGWGADWGVFAVTELWHGAELAMAGERQELALEYIERSAELCRPRQGEETNAVGYHVEGALWSVVEDHTEEVIPSKKTRECVLVMMNNLETEPALADNPLHELINHPHWKELKEELQSMEE